MRNRSRLLLLAAVSLVALTLVPSVGAKLFTKPVHRGSTGKAVAAAQWLLQGNDPNVYRKLIHPFRGRPVTGQFGKHTVEAVLAARWQLGEPVAYAKECKCKPALRKSFGRDLYLILTGRKARPRSWLGIAARRVTVVHPGEASVCGVRIARTARRELGVHEIPWGSNDGPRVRVYQRTTGAYHAPWCASYVQTIYFWAGVGTIANRSAGVFAIVKWAHDHELLRARPAVGAAVAYLSALGHIGVVVRVTRTGFYSIEGNSGNAVRERWHPLGYRRTVFIWPSCLNRRPT